MKENLVGRGTQAKFARKARISTGTVSKWAQGEMDRAPNFENCIRIANYFNLTPIQVFEMADRPDYKALFSELFPDYEQKPAPKDDSSKFLCSNDQHRILQIKLDEVLHSEQRCVDAVTAGVEALYAHCTGNDPDAAAIFPPEKELDPKTLRPKRPRKRTA